MSHPQTCEQAVLQLAQKHPLLRARDVAQAVWSVQCLDPLACFGTLTFISCYDALYGSTVAHMMRVNTLHLETRHATDPQTAEIAA